MGAGSFVATPVLRNVAARGLASISAEIASFEDSLFADDEASSKLLGDADKMAVGTFSIHNLGAHSLPLLLNVAWTGLLKNLLNNFYHLQLLSSLLSFLRYPRHFFAFRHVWCEVRRSDCADPSGLRAVSGRDRGHRYPRCSLSQQ